MNYDVVIGIEIHCELKTATKMFSASPVLFGQNVNTCTSEIDLGHPGTLPCVNQAAVKAAAQACFALQMEIDSLVKFDRKNYYYTDLPKGFQITQQFHPIGRNGFIEIRVDDQVKKIRINRLHMEEDTAKQFHLEEETLIDYNRAGTPLIEIVSEPDMCSAKEAAVYVLKFQEILFYLGVSDVRMEEGSMRCDVNISLKPTGTKEYGIKVEIKNLNSINNVQKAIEFEIQRQSKLLDEKQIIVQETRRYDEPTKETVSMRKKEGTADYKYFPEPNIFPIRLDDQWLCSIQKNLPEMPDVRRYRYMQDFNLTEYDANVLVSNKDLSEFYEQVMQHTKEAKLVANFCITDFLACLAKNGVKVIDTVCRPEDFGQLINMVASQEISTKQAKELLADVVDGKNPKQMAKERGMKQLTDSSQLISLIKEVLDEQPQSIEDYKNGKDRAVGFLVGQIMKKSKGQANPALTNQLLLEELGRR